MGREAGSRGATPGLLLAAAMVTAGGIFLRPGAEPELRALTLSEDTGFWLAFVVGGILMALVAAIFNVFGRLARVLAIVVLGSLVVALVVAVTSLDLETSGVVGYGFVAGGLLVAVGVMFADTIRRAD